MPLRTAYASYPNSPPVPWPYVLQSLHASWNLRLASPRSHLGASLLPGLYDVFFIHSWSMCSLGLCIRQDLLHLFVVELQHGVLVDLLCSSDACCWPCSSLPAVGYALLCLLLAMLFLACCWLCSSLPAVGYALPCLLLAVLFLSWVLGSQSLAVVHGFSGPNPWLFVHGFSGPNPLAVCLWVASSK